MKWQCFHSRKNINLRKTCWAVSRFFTPFERPSSMRFFSIPKQVTSKSNIWIQTAINPKWTTLFSKQSVHTNLIYSGCCGVSNNEWAKKVLMSSSFSHIRHFFTVDLGDFVFMRWALLSAVQLSSSCSITININSIAIFFKFKQPIYLLSCLFVSLLIARHFVLNFEVFFKVSVYRLAII